MFCGLASNRLSRNLVSQHSSLPYCFNQSYSDVDGFQSVLVVYSWLSSDTLVKEMQEMVSNNLPEQLCYLVFEFLKIYGWTLVYVLLIVT